MSKLFYFFLLCLLAASCASPKVMLTALPAGERAAVSFTEALPSICFFEIKDSSDLYRQHKKAERGVNTYFGPVYDHFPIFNISDEHAVQYKNVSGTYIFYRPHTKSRTGMVISNGRDKPVMIDQPENYLTAIKAYLKINSADDIVPKSKAQHDDFSYQAQMEHILKSTFRPDQHYARQLIDHGNTVHYIAARATQKDNCPCKQKETELYADSLLKQKGSYSYIYDYNKNGQMTGVDFLINGTSQGITTYTINSLGLIEKMTSPSAEAPLVTQFIYEPDRYHTVSSEHGLPGSYETFFLNEKKACIRRIAHRADKSLVWDIRYFYDNQGRVIRESQDNSELVYEYDNDTDPSFSTFRNYQLNPRKLTATYEVKKEKNKHIYTGMDEKGNQTFRSITITGPGCDTKTYSYDAGNNLTAVSVSTCKKG